MSSDSLLVVVSGFSGVGKGTVTKKMVEIHKEYALSVSYTTRAPRNDEKDGIAYHFTDNASFEKMIEEGAFYEYAGYIDHYYGTPKAFVDEQRAAGRDVILEIELQGAMKIKERIPDSLMIFLMPPSAVELRNRLISRGSETEDVIRARLNRAVEEADGAKDYDYIVVNDDVDQCISRIHQLIQLTHNKTPENMQLAKRSSAAENMPMIARIKQELIEMLK